jgi:putative ABC transport system permease protein
VVVSDATSRGFGGGAVIRIEQVEEVARVNGVAAAFATIGMLAQGEQGPAFGTVDLIQASQRGFAEHEKFKLHLAQGRDLTSDARGEVVLGADIAKELKVKVGDTIRLPIPPKTPRPDFQSHDFRVVGIWEKTLTQPDSIAAISFADGQMLLGESLPPAIRSSVDASRLATGIAAFGTQDTNLDELAKRITREVPGVRAQPPSELVGQFRSVSVIFTAITTGSALLALVVGGLSVVNTMIMAVTERVREIGLKKAVGARTGHILREYLLEAVVIGLLGGAIGLGLGWALTQVINAATASSNLELFLLTPRLVLFALVFSVGLGAAAGFFPALRAGRLDPVRALRSQ